MFTNYSTFREQNALIKTSLRERGKRLFLALFCVFFGLTGITAQTTPAGIVGVPNNASCPDGAFDFFSWTEIYDDGGIAGGSGEAANGLNVLGATWEYSGTDNNVAPFGTLLIAGQQTGPNATDVFTVAFDAPLTNPILNIRLLEAQTEVCITDETGAPVTLTVIQGFINAGGAGCVTGNGSGYVQVTGTVNSLTLTANMTAAPDAWSFAVGTCIPDFVAPPLPACATCEPGNNFRNINLTGYDSATMTGDIELNGRKIGNSEVVFEDIDYNIDMAGTQFGGFDNDGGTFIIKLEFCEPIAIEEFDIRNLEVESEITVGTSISGTGAAATLGDLVLTQCAGSPRMPVTGANQVITAGPGCGANPNATYTFDAGMVDVLYIKYVNPVGGCSYDYVGFKVSTCVPDVAEQAVPTCPLTVLTLTDDEDAYTAALIAGGTGAAQSFEVIQDANGNYFDRTCANIETAVTNMTEINTFNVSACETVVGEAECTFCDPAPPCVDCPAGTANRYISLSKTGETAGGLDMGEVNLNGNLYGTYEFVFSDLDVNTDGNGTVFGGYDIDGGTMILQIDFCSAIDINQLDVRNLEVESMVSIGTTISGTGAAAVLGGQTLMFCDGSDRMDVDDITNGNTITTAGPGCGANPNASYTFGTNPVSTLFFKYQNPDNGCRGDYVGFRISTCVGGTEPAVPTCPMSILTVTEDIDGYLDAIAAGGTGDAFVTTLLQDANGNYFDRTCAQIEIAVNNGTAVATEAIGPCVEVVDETECTFCTPTPPCNDCPAGSSYEYISLDQTGTNADGLAEGIIEVDGVCIGQYEFEFSDLDVSEDGQGTLFGGFDRDGGTMLLRVDFCEATVINQFDIRNLEVESMVTIGTSVTGTGAAATLSGQTLTFCDGSDRMDIDDITGGNTVTTAGPGCGANPNASYTLGSAAINTMYFKYQNPDGGCRADYVGFRLGLCVEPAPMAAPVCPFETVRVSCEMDAIIANGGVATNFNSDTYVVDGAGNYFNFINCSAVALTNAYNNGTMLQTVNIGCAELVETLEECLPADCVVPTSCVETDCPADSEFDYINLNRNGTNPAGLPMGDIRMDGVVVGDYDFVFSDLDVREDGQGTLFGGWDNDGGTMLLQLNFCDPLLISELDIRNLEVGSEVSVGTAASTMDAAAVLSGMTLSQCSGSDRMTLNDGAPNLVITDGPGCGANPNATYTVSPQAVSTLFFKYHNPPSDGTFPSRCRGDYVGFKVGACRPTLEDFIPICDLTLVDEVVTLKDGSLETNRLWRDESGKYFDINSCPVVIPEAPVFTPVQEYRFSPCGVEEIVEICPVCIRPGLAKDIVGVATPAASGTPSNIDVTFKFTLANYIGEMENLIINDDLTAIPGFVQAFPAQTTVMISANTSGDAIAPSPNPTYNGTGNILDGTSGFLKDIDAIMVTMTAEFDASLVPANLVNIAQGGGSRGGNPPVLDDSVAGLDPDPNGNGDPRDDGNGDPTDLDNGATLFFPSVNLVKSLVKTFPVQACQGTGNVNARFELTLENTGNVDINNLQIEDDLIGQLGSAFVDISFIQYAEITASTATTNPNLNNNFNDDFPAFETTILDGTSGLLEPGQSITIQYIVTMDPDAPNAPAVLENQARTTASAINPLDGSILVNPGTGAPFELADLSDDGTDPDSLNPGEPGDLGTQDDPTPLNGRISSIGLTKETTNVVQSATPGNLNVTYLLTLGNLGNMPVSNIQITDNAAQQLGAAFVGFVSGPAVNGGGAVVNPDFNASFYPDIFNGTTGTLSPGQNMTVTFTIEVNPSLADDPMSLTNQASTLVRVMTPLGGFKQLFDLSDSGSNPASSNINAMGDTGCSDDPTPVFGNFPLIIQAPMDIEIESYGVGSTPLNDWIENNGYLEIITPEECQPAMISNDYSEDSFVSDCSPYSGSATVNFFYSDACGNSYDFSATFTLEDNTAPSCVKPADLTIACDDPDFDATVASYTGYWGPVTDLSHPITIESSYSEDGFDDNGQQIIVWTFTDACGNSRQWDALLTITGDCTSALTVEQPADLNLDCSDDIPATSIVAATTCEGGVVNVADSEVITSMGCAGMYTLVRTYVVSDECGNSETVSQTITVTDSTAPTFTFVPDNIAINCGDDTSTFGFGVATASDACSETTITSVDNLDYFGICEGSVATRTWTATDECGNATTASQTLTVLPDNTAPAFTFVPADATITCPAIPTFGTPTAIDACNDVTITEAVTAIGGCPDGYTTTITWTATDACGNASTASQTITVNPESTSPVLTVTPPTNFNLDCTDAVPGVGVTATTTCADGIVNVTDTEEVTPMGCPGSFTIVRTYNVNDNCGNSEVVTQTIVVTDNTAPVFSFVPADASVDCSADMSGFGTPAAADVCGSTTISSIDTTNGDDVCNGGATTTRTWTATDDCGNATTASQTLTLSSDNVAPAFTFVPADATITCPAIPTFGTPIATDACNNVTITEAVTATGGCPDGYTTTITWTATDACGNASTASQTITVNPEPVSPVLTVIPPTNFNLDCTDAVPGVGVTATTTCADGIVNVTDTEEVTPMGCPGSFTIVRTYNVSDNCGNSEVVTQTIVVVDNTAPVFTFVPAGADVDCTAYPDGFGTAVASDACGSMSLTFEDNLAPYICDADFNITRTWTATDECGNVATASQTLTVWPDVEAPLFSFVPGDMTINCGDAVVFGTPVISDGCTGFTLTEDVTATGACPNGYTTIKTWTAFDGCGNASVQSQTITVVAAPAPITLGFTFVPENKVVECGDVVEFGEPVCAGNCDNGFVMTIEDITTASEECVNTPILTRRWTATDACDNVVTVEQAITIVDTTVPEFINVPADKLVACGESILFNEPVVLDLCSGVSLTFVDETEWANCEGVAYSVTRNWTAVDACGNAATFANTISVEEDAIAPVLSTLEDKVVSCSESVVFDTPVATDNCDDVALSYSDAIIENDCEIVHTRTWVAADGCNNISETVQKVTVIDDVSPTFTIESNSISMPAFAYQNWTAPEVIALDECSNVEAEGPFVFDYGNGRIDHSWTTIDACGNKASVTVTVNIITVIFPEGNLEMTPLTVFPNPTGGKLTLSFGSETESTATVIVTDILGRTYLTQKAATYAGENVIKLDLSDLPQGTYLVKVNDGTQELTDTFIKF